MRRAIAACLAGLLSGGVSAADLMQIYRDALANDARFAAARAEYEAGQERVVQGRAGLLPEIGVGANTTWNDVELRTRGVPEPLRDSFNSNGYALQLTQPLFRWQNWVEFKQGELQTALAGAQFGLAREDLVLRVADAYFNVLNARSDHRSAFGGLFRNRWLWAAIGLSLLLHAAVVYLPFLQQAFSTVSLGADDWLYCAAAASSVLWLREISKRMSHPAGGKRRRASLAV